MQTPSSSSPDTIRFSTCSSLAFFPAYCKTFLSIFFSFHFLFFPSLFQLLFSPVSSSWLPRYRSTASSLRHASLLSFTALRYTHIHVSITYHPAPFTPFCICFPFLALIFIVLRLQRYLLLPQPIPSTSFPFPQHTKPSLTSTTTSFLLSLCACRYTLFLPRRLSFFVVVFLPTNHQPRLHSPLHQLPSSIHSSSFSISHSLIPRTTSFFPPILPSTSCPRWIPFFQPSAPAHIHVYHLHVKGLFASVNALTFFLFFLIFFFLAVNYVTISLAPFAFLCPAPVPHLAS